MVGSGNGSVNGAGGVSSPSSTKSSGAASPSASTLSASFTFDAAFVQRVRDNAVGEKLDLSWKPLGDAGASMLAAALPTASLVHTINLYWTGVGDEGVTAVCKALLAHGGVFTLNLSGNAIGDAGASAVADLLRQTTTLRALYVFANRITAAGAQVLADALRVNRSLHIFNASGNPFGVKGATALVDALEQNPALHSFSLWKSPDASPEASDLQARIDSVLQRNVSDHVRDAPGFATVVRSWLGVSPPLPATAMRALHAAAAAIDACGATVTGAALFQPLVDLVRAGSSRVLAELVRDLFLHIVDEEPLGDSALRAMAMAIAAIVAVGADVHRVFCTEAVRDLLLRLARNAASSATTEEALAALLDLFVWDATFPGVVVPAMAHLSGQQTQTRVLDALVLSLATAEDVAALTIHGGARVLAWNASLDVVVDISAGVGWLSEDGLHTLCDTLPRCLQLREFVLSGFGARLPLLMVARLQSVAACHLSLQHVEVEGRELFTPFAHRTLQVEMQEVVRRSNAWLAVNQHLLRRTVMPSVLSSAEVRAQPLAARLLIASANEWLTLPTSADELAHELRAAPGTGFDGLRARLQSALAEQMANARSRGQAQTVHPAVAAAVARAAADDVAAVLGTSDAALAHVLVPDDAGGVQAAQDAGTLLLLNEAGDAERASSALAPCADLDTVYRVLQGAATAAAADASESVATAPTPAALRRRSRSSSSNSSSDSDSDSDRLPAPRAAAAAPAAVDNGNWMAALSELPGVVPTILALQSVTMRIDARDERIATELRPQVNAALETLANASTASALPPNARDSAWHRAVRVCVSLWQTVVGAVAAIESVPAVNGDAQEAVRAPLEHRARELQTRLDELARFRDEHDRVLSAELDALVHRHVAEACATLRAALAAPLPELSESAYAAWETRATDAYAALVDALVAVNDAARASHVRFAGVDAEQRASERALNSTSQLADTLAQLWTNVVVPARRALDERRQKQHGALTRLANSLRDGLGHWCATTVPLFLDAPSDDPAAAAAAAAAASTSAARVALHERTVEALVRAGGRASAQLFGGDARTVAATASALLARVSDGADGGAGASASTSAAARAAQVLASLASDADAVRGVVAKHARMASLADVGALFATLGATTAAGMAERTSAAAEVAERVTSGVRHASAARNYVSVVLEEAVAKSAGRLESLSTDTPKSGALFAQLASGWAAARACLDAWSTARAVHVATPAALHASADAERALADRVAELRARAAEMLQSKSRSADDQAAALDESVRRRIVPAATQLLERFRAPPQRLDDDDINAWEHALVDLHATLLDALRGVDEQAQLSVLEGQLGDQHAQALGGAADALDALLGVVRTALGVCVAESARVATDAQGVTAHVDGLARRVRSALLAFEAAMKPALATEADQVQQRLTRLNTSLAVLRCEAEPDALAAVERNVERLRGQLALIDEQTRALDGLRASVSRDEPDAALQVARQADVAWRVGSALDSAELLASMQRSVQSVPALAAGSVTIERGGEPLGKGSFSVVYRGTLNGAVSVAVKEFAADAVTASARLQRDVAVYMRAQNERLVRLFGVLVDGSGAAGNRASLVMERLGRDLARVLKASSASASSVSARQRLRWVADAARACEALHAAGIVHGDIKPSNVMLESEDTSAGLTRAKLGDFGLSRLVSAGALTSVANSSQARQLGSVQYVAPELVAAGRRPRYTAAADVYALAVTSVFVLTGADPFPGLAGHAVVAALQAGKVPTLPSALLPAGTLGDAAAAALRGVLTACVQERADARPAAAALRVAAEQALDSLAPPGSPSASAASAAGLDAALASSVAFRALGRAAVDDEDPAERLLLAVRLAGTHRVAVLGARGVRASAEAERAFSDALAALSNTQALVRDAAVDASCAPCLAAAEDEVRAAWRQYVLSVWRERASVAYRAGAAEVVLAWREASAASASAAEAGVLALSAEHALRAASSGGASAAAPVVLQLCAVVVRTVSPALAGDKIASHLRKAGDVCFAPSLAKPGAAGEFEPCVPERAGAADLVHLVHVHSAASHVLPLLTVTVART